MTTVKGIYEKGTIKLLGKLPEIKMGEVVISFVKLPDQTKQGNAQEVLNTLYNYRGILPKNFIKESSAVYVSKIRKRTNKEWEQRIKRLGIR